MKALKIAALTLLLSMPLAHTMDDDCAIKNQLFFIGMAGICVYKGIPVLKNTVKDLAKDIKLINDTHDYAKNVVCREEADAENVSLSPRRANRVTLDELIFARYRDSSEQDLEAARKSEIKERKNYALIVRCAVGSMCVISLLGLYIPYQCYTQN